MLPYTRERLGCRVEHLERILSRHDHPNLGFCFDTGHALVSAGEKALELFRFMKDSGIAFHLDIIAGDRDSHLAPVRGRIFWKEYFAELQGMNFQNTICVEAPPFSYGPDYSLEAWKILHEDLGTLAETNP
jgi:sugar phosphate isomerase/epimerase